MKTLQFATGMFLIAFSTGAFAQQELSDQSITIHAQLNLHISSIPQGSHFADPYSDTYVGHIGRAMQKDFSVPPGQVWYFQPMGRVLTERELRSLLDEIKRVEAPGLSLTPVAAGFELEIPAALDQWARLDTLTSLRLLNLNGLRNPTHLHEILDAASSSNLQTLQLQDAALLTETNAIIERMTSLRNLDLSHSPRSLQLLSSVVQLPLLALRLRNSDIRADDVRTVSEISSLHELDLSANSLESKDFSSIVRLRELIHLDISDCDIDDEIGVVIQKLPKLRTLSLGNAQITDEIIGPLRSCKNLDSLSIRRGSVSDQGLARLIETHPLTSLDISGCTRLTGEGMEAIASLRSLEHLDAAETQITDATVQMISAKSGLKSLTLDGTSVTDDCLEAIGRIDTLEKLSLQGTRISDNGISRLRGLKHLKTLDLSQTATSDVGVTELARSLQNLEVLVVGGTDISDETLVALATCDSLWHLSLYNCSRITDDGLDELAKCKQLAVLDLPHDAPLITSKGIRSLSRQVEGLLIR